MDGIVRRMQFDSQLEQLRKKFADNLPARLQEIQQLYQEQLQDGGQSAPLRQALHRLTGLAGTFKANRISELTRSIEMHYAQSQTDAPHETQKIIAILFQRLQEAVETYLAQPIPTNPPPAPSFPLSRSQKTICLIEDDAVQAKQMAAVLEENGYRVNIHQTLTSSSSFINQHQSLPALIIMEAHFIEEDENAGQYITDLKQRISDFPPIIFISSRSDTLSRIKAVRAGASEYLLKPVANNHLVDTVEKYLNTSVSHRILIVDDDPITAGYVSHIVQGAGMQTQALTMPLQIFDVLDSFKPDLLILDIHMPECSGIELAQAIRQCCCYNLMPILFMTTGTDIDQELSALSSGGDEFIRKTDPDVYLLQKLASRLRRMNQIRSLNDQLHRAQQRSERLRKSQNDFLTYVTHELKSPLHVILGFSDLLRMDEQLNPEQAEMVNEIVRGGQNQLAIIEDLSEQVKIATGSLTLNIEHFEIAALLKQAVADASVLGLQSGITVKTEFDPDQPLHIKADRRRVTQILNNLLSNAIKYNKLNGKVWVSMQKRSNGMLRINVVDTGIGIAHNDLDYVFEAFERLNAAQDHNIEGIGIGLSICSQLINLMAGHIGVESELNVGSQFWIELPLI